MDIGLIANVITGLLGALLAGAWARTAAAISRNGREVSELRGRISAMESNDANIMSELGNAHRRIGGVGRVADQTAGEVRQMRGTLTVLQQSAMGRVGEGVNVD